MIVTDAVRQLKNGDVKYGFYMDPWMKTNLDDLPKFLKKAWDCVGIVSGHGKVRIGKSTMAMQIGYYVAWMLAGGKTNTDETGKKVIGIVPPPEPINFTLEENVVFSADDLIKTAFRLHDKYGKNQVIIYDEGRQGLDSARAMESVNKGMEDFFQECGFMGHVIIIVLPNFFKLHEDYAVARSLFLIDVYASETFERGRFSFYNEYKKEKLFFFGKKMLGVRAKYAMTDPNFSGRFTGWLPFDKDAYELRKKQALRKKRMGRIQKRFKKERDSTLFVLQQVSNMSCKEISEVMASEAGIKMGERLIELAISNAKARSVSEAL